VTGGDLHHWASRAAESSILKPSDLVIRIAGEVANPEVGPKRVRGDCWDDRCHEQVKGTHRDVRGVLGAQLAERRYNGRVESLARPRSAGFAEGAGDGTVLDGHHRAG
jgi:hypothetical protein